ncbi:MAG: MerR family transcriptional regulator [Clostridia bacterium]|nr:MerR family transcriptional regulator [Clostridia bacterium]
MSTLIKIRDVSSQYDISARTLRYYEDMGLISSSRSEDYAYRMYDGTAIKRLEQILVLRKLNISIRDIQRIFSTPGSEVVLEVLGKKVDDIDEEVSLLQELREIILEFIHQIEKSDFADEGDVKLLYERAKEIETEIVDYQGNPSNANRLLDVTEKLRKPPVVQVIRVPGFRAVTSGPSSFANLFGEGGFDKWIGKNLNLIDQFIFDAHDFMWGGETGVHWIFKVKDGVTEADTAPYKIIDFPGGIYATTVSIDEFSEYDMNSRIREDIVKWLEETNFELNNHPTHGYSMTAHMIYPDDDEITKGLGYKQLELYISIKVKGQ